MATCARCGADIDPFVEHDCPMQLKQSPPLSPELQIEGQQLLVVMISGLLHGLPPAMQSAVLAELLAKWLAGHVMPEQRAIARSMHLSLVDSLVDGEARELLKRVKPGGSG